MRLRSASSVVSVTIAALVVAALPAISTTTPEFLTEEYLASIDDASISGTITPPGAELFEKQAELNAYDELAQGYRTLTEDELTTKYFKDAAWGNLEVGRSYSPRADVTIKRAADWGDPHIYGVTDLGMAFGAGYVAGEDRLPILTLLRALGRAEAFELLGDNASWLADAEIVRLYGYTEQEFQDQIDRMPAEFGQAGQDLVDLLDALVAGINTFIVDARAGVVPTPAALADIAPIGDIPLFTTTDIVAIVAIVRALFGADGGNELGAAARWAELVNVYGEDDAESVYEDFRNRYNNDGPLHTTDEQFQYMEPQVELPGTVGNVLGYTSGNPGLQGTFEELGTLLPMTAAEAARDLAVLQEASRMRWEDVVLDTGSTKLDLSRSGAGSMSNYLIAGGSRTTTGTPLLLGGPQAGYFDPQILMENTLHSPNFHVAGSTFPGLGLVIVGRTQDYAWSPTAGGSDMIDTYVEVLCDPDGDTPTEQEVHYVHDLDGDGTTECIPMDVRTHREATELPGGELLPAIMVERSVHGPITARGRIGELAVAISRKRTTYLKELDPGVSILKLNRNEATTGQDFVDIFAESHTLATNWGYVNDTEIAYFHGGLFPIRPTDIHPDFPVWGTGQWEWERNADGTDSYLDGLEHPHEVSPEKDFFVSWNNRQAPGWSEDDSGWGFSALYRADMLEDQIVAEGEAGRKIDAVRLTQLMEHAGLTDFRGSHVLPLVLRVLEAGSAPDERTAEMVALLATWLVPDEDYAWGALRRDGDNDGEYEHAAAIAIMDAWWDPMLSAMYDPALGQPIGSVSRQGSHNAPSAGGSAFQGGLYGQAWTDLSMLLGDDVKSPTDRTYCGGADLSGGSLGACADALWASLVDVAAGLESSQDSATPSDWAASAQAERILFLPTAVLSMDWVNRPTTQVFAQFAGDGAATTAPAPGAEVMGSGLAATGGGNLLAALLALLLAGLLTRRRRVDA
jgi:acyl-homoserine lactone acylase PvdQ